MKNFKAFGRLQAPHSLQPLVGCLWRGTLQRAHMTSESGLHPSTTVLLWLWFKTKKNRARLSPFQRFFGSIEPFWNIEGKQLSKNKSRKKSPCGRPCIKNSAETAVRATEVSCHQCPNAASQVVWSFCEKTWVKAQNWLECSGSFTTKPQGKGWESNKFNSLCHMSSDFQQF